VGVPEQLTRHLVCSFADVRDNQLDEASTDLQTLLGRPPASLREGLTELFVAPVRREVQSAANRSGRGGSASSISSSKRSWRTRECSGVICSSIARLAR
jgi:hypothetical protein